jgi:hypothetical protein
MVARFTRNAPGTWFQKYRVKLHAGCRGNGAAGISSGKPVLISGRNKSSCWATENNRWPTVLPIKAALNQTFELLKTLSPPLSVEQKRQSGLARWDGRPP